MPLMDELNCPNPNCTSKKMDAVISRDHEMMLIKCKKCGHVEKYKRFVKSKVALDTEEWKEVMRKVKLFSLELTTERDLIDLDDAVEDFLTFFQCKFRKKEVTLLNDCRSCRLKLSRGILCSIVLNQTKSIQEKGDHVNRFHALLKESLEKDEPKEEDNEREIQ